MCPVRGSGGEGHLLHRVALVIVEAALHGYDWHAAYAAHYQAAGVPLHRRHREVWYLVVVNAVRNLNLVHEAAKASPEYDAYARAVYHAALEVRRRLFNLV